MIRKSLLALAACSVIDAGIAQADDLGPAARGYNWTGFYAGIQAGYGRDRNSVEGRQIADDPAVIETLPYTVGMGAKGMFGGLQAGYNWQTASFVYGIEADLSYASIDGQGTQNALFSPFGPLNGQFAQTHHELSWLATFRGRLGITPVDRLLIYATGGLALGRVEYASLRYVGPTIQFESSDSASKFGWALGGGMEWALPGNWRVKAEYLHYDLGRHTVIYSDAGFASLNSSLESGFKSSGDIVRAGLNYRFN